MGYALAFETMMLRLSLLAALVASVVSSGCAPMPAPPPAVPEGPWQARELDLPGRIEGGPLHLRYLTAGPEDAPTVVLLHGFPDAIYGWRYVIPLLASDHRVLVPTLRGYTGASMPRHGYDLPTLSGDLLAFIEATARPGTDPKAPVDLIAHDWGASIGWQATTDAPERFRSFTALDVPHPVALERLWEQSREQRRYGRFVRKLVTPGASAFLSGMKPDERRELMYYDELHDDGALRPEDQAFYDAAFDDRADVWGPLRYYKVLARERRTLADRFERAGPVKVRTLVLWGAHDHYMLPPLAALSCEQVAAECEHQVLEDAGHYLQWEQPDALVAAWRKFAG